jgi:uncharacterized protein
MKHRIWLAAVLMWILAGPIAAQAQTQPSRDQLAAAGELATVARLDESMRSILPMIMQQLKPAVVQGRKEVERDFDTLNPVLIGAMNDRMKEFIELIAVIYANHFTAAELRDIVAFYRTPTGQKFVQSQAPLAQQAMSAGQQFAQKLIVDMQERMKQELRKKGHTL